MEIKNISEIKTQQQAQDKAIEFQNFFSENSLSYGEIEKFNSYFKTIAKKFNLEEEFKENGII